MINITVTNPYHDATYRIKDLGTIGNEEPTEDQFIEHCKENIRGGHAITFTDVNGTFTSIHADKFASVDIWKSK